MAALNMVLFPVLYIAYECNENYFNHYHVMFRFACSNFRSLFMNV